MKRKLSGFRLFFLETNFLSANNNDNIIEIISKIKATVMVICVKADQITVKL